jgi:hypothetical protein
MADNKNNFIPRSNAINDSDRANVASLLPAFYKTDANKKFFKSTLTQLTQSGSVNKVSGYIGRMNSKATTSDDVFVNAPTRLRQNYQLEPGFVIENDLGNNIFLKDYQDYINQLRVFGANVSFDKNGNDNASNHSRVNKEEFYSWNPHIDWDKFVNFQNYYWMPNGADTVTISTALQYDVISTYSVSINSESYLFSANTTLQNPTITLYKGYTYYFKIDSTGHPFSIKTDRDAGEINRYITPTLLNNATETGIIEFTVPDNAPSELFYVSESDVNFGGLFIILDPAISGELNVDADIIGKLTYQFGSNSLLSNGMKVRFVGNIYPAEYKTGRYYVEGVGESIQLINESQLEIITPYTTSESILFDTSKFDTTPFSDAVSYSGKPDYIVINRGSNDKNGWSRNNRWIHKAVIEQSATLNGIHASFDQSMRAVRPIIEFEKNLKLFNFGSNAITDVSVIDQFTVDAFSTIEGSLGYSIDGVTLTNGQRVIFTADTDSLVANNIYRVEFIDVKHEVKLGSTSAQIRLVLESYPEYDQVVLVKEGRLAQGSMYWFNGISWVTCQQKTELNQLPLFDAYNEDLISFGDTSTYPGTTFKGTSIFSYKVGNGTVDNNLGFSLSHKNINNIGDIVFNFTLLSDTFQYEYNGTTVSKQINTGFLYSSYNGFVNGWETYVGPPQAAIRLYRNSNKTNNFDIDIFDVAPAFIQVRVYVNGVCVPQQTYVDGVVVNNWIQTIGTEDAILPYYRIIFSNDVKVTDTIMFKVYANTTINSNGYYEFPNNIQNNPLNGELTEFTLGEVIDHVESIVDNLRATTEFLGDFPGVGNLRDLGSVSKFGTKFIQHSGPASLAVYHITSDSHNVIRAIDQARDDYCKFKRIFINLADSLGVDLDTVPHTDLILQTIIKDTPATSSYYFSDMVPTGSKIRTDFLVADSSNTIFSLSAVFSLSKLSNKAVNVYLNDLQLLHRRDYTFSDQGFVTVTAELVTGDIISIFEYDTTDGCLVPETPTKLGMWPKYEPKMYLDTTLVTPRWMIQGHDGSLTLAYNDYRDDLILELEKRIYNNIKVAYDESIFDINDVIPCYYQLSDYSLQEFNDALMSNFYSWSLNIGIDFSTPLTYDDQNPFTFNYKNHIAADGTVGPKYWRGIYQWMLRTDRPHICPWEMLGFSEEPLWWVSVYGPAPYTKDNLILWEDLSNGLVKDPAFTYNIFKHIKPDLLDHIPVDSDGRLVDPRISNFTTGIISQSNQGDFTFGDVSPLESAWRRHSHYSFSVIKTAILLTPAKTIGLLLDRSRIKRNNAGQLIYSETGLRIKPSDIVLPSIYLGNDRVQTAGLLNYLVNYLNCESLQQYNEYKHNLKLITAKLCYRVSGFTSKEKFNLLLDSKSPTTVGSVFIPQEDYTVVLNTSSPIATITYSGVIITKVEGGFEIKGYSKLQPYFRYYEGLGVGTIVNIGGISEAYAVWGALQTFVEGKIVLYNKKYYRVTTTHVASSVFDNSYFAMLGELPIIGGVSAGFKQKWVKTPVILQYGSKLDSIQAVVDFLLGYGQWLIEQGFDFNDFNTDLRDIANWETSAKEFLFWTTSNWKSMQDTWYEWSPYTAIQRGDIVRFNGSYFTALKSIQSDIFNIGDYEFLPGLDIVGSALISLSPAANKLTFTSILSVVDSISNTNNICELLDISGHQITVPMIQLYRTDNAISYSPRDESGIYCASFYLVQHEHVVILNNSTMFNDTIYNLESGYKQDKLKVSGYVSTLWNGSLDVPGFVIDQAKISEWTPWKSYAVSDVVQHRSFFYSAKSSIQGDETFVDDHWVMLSKKPTSKLLPNWNYKASQFTDFYSLDSENFDVNQQKMAQHLTGYQKRQYLENIIQDDVSEYKFYQGMILEKGTQNVLNKLFDVLSADDQSSLQFYEEWAVRSGQYGACNAFDTLECVLDESLFKTNPQGFELVDSKPLNTDLVIRHLPTDLYVKPVGYRSATAFQAAPSVASSAIYARLDEVKTSVKSHTELLALNILNYTYYDYILCTFVENSWNVYQYVKLPLSVVSVEQIDTGYTITVHESISFANNAFIGIKDNTHTTPELIDGFFKVSNVNYANNSFEIAIPNSRAVQVVTARIEIGILVARKISSIDNNTCTFNELLPAIKVTFTAGSGYTMSHTYNAVQLVYVSGSTATEYPTANITTNDKGLVDSVTLVTHGNGFIDNTTVMTYYGMGSGTGFTVKVASIVPSNNVAWVDNENGQWETWKYNPVYKSVVIDNGIFNGSVGSKIVANKEGNLVAVLTPTNVYIFKLQLTSSLVKPVDWVVLQKLNIVASEIALSKDGSWLATTENNKVKLYKNNSSDYYEYNFTLDRPSSPMQFGKTLTFDNTTLFIGTNNNRIYKATYSAIESATVQAYYNPNGSSQTTLVVSSAAQLVSGMRLSGIGFTTGQTIRSIINSTTVLLDEMPDSTPEGVITFSKIAWQINTSTFIKPSSTFGKDVVISDNNVLAVLAASHVYVYNNYDNYTDPIITIPATDFSFASSIAISKNADYVAVLNSSYILVYSTDTLERIRILNPSNMPGSYATSKVQFVNNFNTIIVKSDTTVDIFDIYKTKWQFSERITGIYGTSFISTSSNIIVTSDNANQIHHYIKPTNTYSWAVQHRAITKPNISKIKQVIMYDKNTNTPVKYLDIVDPVQEKFPEVINREVKFKTTYDPATYSVGNSTVNVDEGIAWAADQVGVLWWDKRTTKFMDNYTDNVVYRNSVWSTLAPGASVDVYEWVKSTVKPSVWDDDAGTEAGLALGISGTSLYGDLAYSTVSAYDTLSQRFTYTYYFWVKNKTTISISGRELSASDASAIIANPRGEGYQCIALTGENSFSLVNVRPLLTHTNIVLLIEYWLIDKTDQNIHTQWKLISSSPQSILPANIEQKWINSLCGNDEYNRIVPDQKIPVKLRYGIENRPRQSMFVNRFEALKQHIEEVNRILRDNDQPIVDTCNLSNLQKYDIPPTLISGLYDKSIDTDAELQFVITKKFVKASVAPVIVNGKIIDILVVEPGRGYVVAPTINVHGVGINARIKAKISSTGSIEGCEILNAGEGYLQNTVLTIRSFSVLVSSDLQANGKWSIYSYEPSTSIWSKSVSQAYDTMQYWHKVDWYAPSYSQFTAINHAVNTYADLGAFEIEVGQTVKVLTTTANRWVLLKKWKEIDSTNWADAYNVVGSQEGTIQFSSLLYNFLNTPVGYDGMLYDLGVYDNYALVELRIILNAIKDDLLIDNSKYLSLFFASVRYAMSEQTYVDWIFKTSFVNVMHNVGSLRKSVTYKNDNLANFEDYVSEVKPYRTQIREYVSSYNSIETAELSVTDFDLPAIINPTTKRAEPMEITVYDDIIFSSHYALDELYPWKHWLDNVGFSVTSINIIDGGSGYVTEPIVNIVSSWGSGATARAFILNGSINRIIVLTPGSKYRSTPTVVITGGVSNDGTPAVAAAIIGNSVIRTNLIKMKFDRVSQLTTITELEQAETILTTLVTGNRLQFPLKWAPNVKIGTHSVTVNGLLEIRDNYTLQVVKSTSKGFTEYTGAITFSHKPEKNSVIVVNYLIDSSVLNAVDRIEHYYNPQIGDLGKDLAQLMVGIDYGGVEVSGLDFNVKHGWESYTYDTIKWDNVNSKFNDVKVVYTTGGVKAPVTIHFPDDGFNIPAIGTELNVYYDANPANRSPIRIDGTAIMQTPTVTGDVTTIVIPELFFEILFEAEQLDIPSSCMFIVREVTSDGTDENDNDYDVAISGGRFSASSASGLAPEDIVIDGDKFENIFAGPEEIVPGQVVDTVAIKVYTTIDNVTYTYMQFKDMLNRVHYKRLPASKQTTLTVMLLNTDTTITLDDVSMLDQPDPLTNKPGVIEIGGERIEYFTINNNTVGQLRRGTLGTSIPEIHYASSIVQIIGISETIPYADTTLIEYHSLEKKSVIRVDENSELYHIYGKSIVVNLSFRPNKSKIIWKGAESASIVRKGFGQCNDIEVFVGGYDSSSSWMPNVFYNTDDIVTFGSYTYKCKSPHTSADSFKSDYDIWGFFVGNIRLQKTPYKVFNERLGIEEVFPADFSVNGIFKTVRLSQTFMLGDKTLITVIKRTGNKWVADQTIINFINAVPGAEHITLQDTFDNITDTFGSDEIQF